MAKVFTKIGKNIVIAIKEGGPNPETNAKLRAVIQNARAANMPKDNILRAIKRASDKDTTDFKEVMFEGFAPHGVAVLIETATDNNQRTVANVRSYFSKCNGSLGTSGSVSFMFDHSCHFKIEKEGIDVEELELEFIDYGAEEVFEEEDGILIYGEFQSFGALQSNLEDKGMKIISSGMEWIPNVMKEIDEEHMPEVDKLLEKLDEDDDVLNVFHNMKDGRVQPEED